jgi:hypothetical protein
MSMIYIHLIIIIKKQSIFYYNIDIDFIYFYIIIGYITKILSKLYTKLKYDTIKSSVRLNQNSSKILSLYYNWLYICFMIR